MRHGDSPRHAALGRRVASPPLLAAKTPYTRCGTYRILLLSVALEALRERPLFGAARCPCIAAGRPRPSSNDLLRTPLPLEREDRHLVREEDGDRSRRLGCPRWLGATNDHQGRQVRASCRA